ncbi:MAG: lantibiotic immunity ABC transporter MutE/EpiE family permease subunit [Oscillospiraceae bacterium]
MVNYLKAEFLKQKHQFVLKLLWISPIVPIALALVLMGGGYFMEGAFNWWYTLILPGTLSMLASFTISSEKKHNRHGLFAVCVDKKKLWISQVFANTILLLVANLIFFVFMIAIGAFLGIEVPLIDSLVASIVLFVTFAWQVPAFMFLSERTGAFFSITTCLFCNFGFGIFFAPTKLWWVPFAIPARLMCPIIKVMPNGLPLQEGHVLGNSNVILLGIIITTALFIALSFITTLWFNKREAR